MHRRGSNNEHRNDDHTHAVMQPRPPLFFLAPLAGAFAAIATRQCRAEVTGERELRFIRDVAELSHHPPRSGFTPDPEWLADFAYVWTPKAGVCGYSSSLQPGC